MLLSLRILFQSKFMWITTVVITIIVFTHVVFFFVHIYETEFILTTLFEPIFNFLCDFSQNYISQLLVCSSIPIKPKRLTNSAKSLFKLPDESRNALVGCLLGDLFASQRHLNTRLMFKQGIVHEGYLMHLYDKFSYYCPSEPKIKTSAPDIDGKVQKGIYFNTYSLPCFNELYDSFYVNNVKIVPVNISELLTAEGLAYFICDDGYYSDSNKIVKLCTESFTEADVELLIGVLENKFHLKCRKEKRGKGFRIVIKNQSLGRLRELVQAHMHSSMLYKLGPL